MNTTATATRIHPLMATASVSVIIVSLTGAAAITGMLPSSRSAPEPQAVLAPTAATPLAPTQLQAAMQTQAQYAAPVQPAPMVVSAAPGTTTYIQAANTPAAPVVIVKQEPAPVVKQAPAPKPRVVERVVERRIVEHRPAPQTVRYEEPTYRQAPAPAQPSYVGIGTGAVIGGLIGNQVGGGNGKKLATLAGIIGGGYLGNEVAKRNGQ
ncbi:MULTISPECIES: hypothetical protein [unclassified Massilia]|uniref:hypothetical protein n=1 Tax=unclassified Massilia TaxID=2609279 RepID=UPI0017874ABD|nr:MULTISPECIES: hypothetical protein [unclassified Massilia]MBD8531937.1 hypothetical protein [Massilia sp. CFBP 13647]MBD8675449.1 hypothetical protein [Massilia sp. CFBP 13721]